MAGSSKPLVVTAEIGYGKSALLSTWIDGHQRECENDAVVYVFVGASEKSTSMYIKSFYLVEDAFGCTPAFIV